jgi:hypothetical protein
VQAALIAAGIFGGCATRRPAFTPKPETAAECDDRKRELVEFVTRLPAASVAAPTRVKLAESTLGGVPGTGSLLEITADEARLNGKPLAGDLAQRARALREQLAAIPSPELLYVAPSSEIEVKTLRAYFAEIPESVELRLLVRSPTSSSRGATGEGSDEARALAEKILLEPDPIKRRAIADQGYQGFAECPALLESVSSLRANGEEPRWPSLQTRLAAALPRCECQKLDTASLRQLVAAEQRAGSAAIAWLPIAFLRDERCDASMPLRSVQKLVRQMEEFDAEFAGGWQKDALRFDEVVNNDRLGVQFCDALPGETLAAKQRSRATLYLRVPGSERCDSVRFEPIAKGSPLGTLHRVSASRPALAFHYSQAAEEIRVFGPADPASGTKPTESRKWPCDETFRLVGVDRDSIQLERGRWYYTQDGCDRATGGTMEGGCVAATFAGVSAKTKPATSEHNSSDARR